MTAILLLADADGGGTTYTAIARHRNPDTRKAHEDMGFFDGWGTVAAPIRRGTPGPDDRTRECRHIARPPAGAVPPAPHKRTPRRSEEHTSELQSLMRISYAVFCLKKKINNNE